MDAVREGVTTVLQVGGVTLAEVTGRHGDVGGVRGDGLRPAVRVGLEPRHLVRGDQRQVRRLPGLLLAVPGEHQQPACLTALVGLGVRDEPARPARLLRDRVPGVRQFQRGVRRIAVRVVGPARLQPRRVDRGEGAGGVLGVQGGVVRLVGRVVRGGEPLQRLRGLGPGGRREHLALAVHHHASARRQRQGGRRGGHERVLAESAGPTRAAIPAHQVSSPSPSRRRTLPGRGGPRTPGPGTAARP